MSLLRLPSSATEQQISTHAVVLVAQENRLVLLLWDCWLPFFMTQIAQLHFSPFQFRFSKGYLIFPSQSDIFAFAYQGQR